MGPADRRGDLPSTVDCPYCRARLDTRRARSVLRHPTTGDTVREVTEEVRAGGLLGLSPAEHGNTYLVCERSARLPSGATARAARGGWSDANDWTTEVVDGAPATTAASDTGGDDWGDDADAPPGYPAPRGESEETDDRDRLPEPHYIPYLYCQLPDPLNIGLVGTSQSGKSHLLAAMLHRLREEHQELARLDISVGPFAEMWDRYMQREDVAGFLAPDRRTTIRRSGRYEPVEFRMAYIVTSTWGGRQRSRVVSFFDVAGELFDDPKVQERLQFIYGLDAYLFVADGQALHGWDGKRHGLRTQGGFDSVLNKVKQYEGQLAHAQGRPRDIPLPKPAAVVMTKADLQLAQREPWVAKWLERDDEFDLATVDEESEDVYVYCATNGAKAWLQPVVDCEDVTLHFASATGCPENRDGTYNKSRFRHMRVLRPLLSLLAMAEIIDPQEIGRTHVRGVREPVRGRTG